MQLKRSFWILSLFAETLWYPTRRVIVPKKQIRPHIACGLRTARKTKMAG